jgi:hypothetical protein
MTLGQHVQRRNHSLDELQLYETSEREDGRGGLRLWAQGLHPYGCAVPSLLAERARDTGIAATRDAAGFGYAEERATGTA